MKRKRRYSTVVLTLDENELSDHEVRTHVEKVSADGRRISRHLHSVYIPSVPPLAVSTQGHAESAADELHFSNNGITNADTEGYSRKRANLVAGARIDGNFGQVGYGVDIQDIRRMRDELLDRQMQAVESQVGEHVVRCVECCTRRPRPRRRRWIAMRARS